MCVRLAGVCRFGSDSECIFRCHCQSDKPCNRETGHCDGGCEQAISSGGPYTGPGCQIGRSAGPVVCRGIYSLLPFIAIIIITIIIIALEGSLISACVLLDSTLHPSQHSHLGRTQEVSSVFLIVQQSRSRAPYTVVDLTLAVLPILCFMGRVLSHIIPFIIY